MDIILAQLPYLFYGSAFILGIMHGSDPGHGWILAASMGHQKNRIRTFLASTTITVGHFISSIVVVMLIWLLKESVIGYFSYVDIIAGFMLIAIGAYGIYKEFNNKESELNATSLTELFKYSLILGFAHEEEVALASMILLGSNPLLLATVYGSAVYLAILFWAFLTSEIIIMSGERGYKLAETLSRSTPLILIALGLSVIFL